MIVRIVFLLLSFQIFSQNLNAQDTACKSMRTGNFKIVVKDNGTTFITRTAKLQTEKHEPSGFEMTFDVTWIDACTYELRPKKLIKGDPSFLGDGKRVLTTKIKQVTDSSYTAETSSNFFPGTMEFVVDRIKK